MTRYLGIIVVAGAMGIVWIANLLELFHAPDGWVYDQSVSLGGWRSPEIPSVLMVEIDARKEFTAKDGLAVLGYLQQLGARQVIFLSLPSGADARFHQQALDFGNVIVGETVDSNRYSYNTEPLTAYSKVHAAGSAILPTGALYIPSAEFGIHRRSTTSVQLSEYQLPTLAMVTALGLGKQPESGVFKVNFNAGPDWLPRVSADRVLDQGLIPELVKGRSVLIGNSRLPSEPGIYTPINANGQGMSLLEFQAYAIDTLLQGKRIRTIPWTLNLLMLGLIGFLSLVVYQWLNLDRSNWFTILLVAGYLGLGWFLLHALRIWIPVVEMAIAQILMFWLFIRFKLLQDDQEMRHTVLQTMTRLQDYMLPPDFYNLEEHWAEVIAFVDQTLNLNRVIFLEKVEGDHRVREVQALRCSLQDIDERRRDFERTPYSDAIAEGGPIRLEHRLFFADVPSGASVQYLVPLQFGGEIQGFWAFDVDPNAIGSAENFLENIRDFANQIAELLYHRHRWVEQCDAEKNAFRRLFRLEAGKTTSRVVREMLELLDNRLTALQAVFDGLATAAIQYDLFGRVVQLNSSMEEFMRRQDLPGYELTALDLLIQISGLPRQRARRLLQQVIVDRRNFHTPMKLGGTLEENRSVHVKPLEVPETEATQGRTTAPFELSGILFELIDESGLRKRFEVKEQLLEWMRLRIGSELTAVLGTHDIQQKLLLASGSDLETLAEAQKTTKTATVVPLKNAPVVSGGAESTRSVCDRLTEVLATLDRVQLALSADWTNPSSSTSPVDAYPLLTSSIAEGRVAANEKRLQITTEIPRLVGLVEVEPDRLGLLFKAILETLITDAAADTELTIKMQETEGSVHFMFNNTGFGIPDAHLQAYLWQPDYGVTAELKDLREAVQPVVNWGGTIEIHSEIGIGMWARLELKVVS